MTYRKTQFGTWSFSQRGWALNNPSHLVTISQVVADHPLCLVRELPFTMVDLVELWSSE